MTSTLEKIVTSFALIGNRMNRIKFATNASEDVKFVQDLIKLEQGALIAYIENIKHKRRQMRANQKNNRKLRTAFIEERMQYDDSIDNVCEFVKNLQL